MPKSLITGGAGFIGSHLAHHCLALGQEVVILDDLSGGFVDQVPPGVEFIRGSICDEVLVNRLFEAHAFDYVYHLAAYAAEGLSHYVRRYNYQTNLIGSVNLINAAVQYELRCFVFASSIAVYGTGQLPMREDALPLPEDPYGIAKHAVELDLKAARELFGLNYIVFRPHNVYGPHQNLGDPYRNVIGIFMNQLMQEQPMRIFGDGSQTRAFSYIDDVVAPMARSVMLPQAYNETFNLGADQAHSIQALAAMIARAFDVPLNTLYMPARPEVKHAYADHGKAQQVFDLPESTPLECGITHMAHWAKRIGPRPNSRAVEIELPKHLPRAWELTPGRATHSA